MSLFEVYYASRDDNLRITNNLILTPNLIFLMRNMLEFLALICSEHLVFDCVSHTLFAAGAVFGMLFLLILILLNLRLFLELFRDYCLEVLHIGVVFFGDLALLCISHFRNLLIHIYLLLKLIEFLQEVVELAVEAFGFLDEHSPVIISLIDLQLLPNNFLTLFLLGQLY